MEFTLTIIFALLGAAVGSFLNVCIDRLPAGKSLVRPSSRCDACQHSLSPKDLIPVVSYLWLKGHCRYCRIRIPLRSLLVELAVGLIFAFTYRYFGISIELFIVLFYCSLFILIIIIDLEHQLILNKVIFPASLVTLAILVIDSFIPGWGLLANLKGFWSESGILSVSILSGIIGGTTGFVFLLIPMLIYSKGMGAGDVKLAGLIGLVTSFPLVFIAMFIGVFSGGLVAIMLLLLKIRGRKDAIPYGVFLGLGAIITLFWGRDILDWYLGLIGL